MESLGSGDESEDRPNVSKSDVSLPQPALTKQCPPSRPYRAVCPSILHLLLPALAWTARLLLRSQTGFGSLHGTAVPISANNRIACPGHRHRQLLPHTTI